ncbi:hypothetical protein LAZ67_19001593 [Cordylochernes scorpioides]|uniref:Retrovirus-related Pol polyprotein from transposon TNT 1-94 n=1 Tax=Cordylochernes scorpioides TaxID=51811 RepID=A0ABY6LJH6_9ARAC|nr:hypothetical protein LAZ67_19001593 [Cordylochernes scorpioides]
MENSVQVPKFDGKNFASWKFRIVSILEGKELDDLLKGDPPKDEVKFKEWKKKDAQAKGIITCAMTDSLVALILNCKTSKDIWIALHERYEGDKKKKIIEARNDVSRLTMKKEENWEEYLYRSEKLLEQARNLGAEIEDQEFTTSVIRGLPQKYNLVALQLNCQMKKRKEIPKHSIQYIKNLSQTPGHKAIECWHNPKNKRGSENKQTSKNKPEHQNKAKFVNLQPEEHVSNIKEYETTQQPEEWVIDSGASCHMTSNRDLLKEEREVHKTIKLADDSEIISNAEGAIEIEGQNKLIRLNDVLYVEKLSEETIPETSEEVENHDDHSHSDFENQDEHPELPYNLRPNLKDKLYYELSSDDEPIEDNEGKDPTYDPTVGALKLSHGNLLPSSYEEAINHPDSPLWQQAMDKEIHSLQNHHVWDLTELPEGAKAIKSKWIFSKKMDPQTNQEIYKARLVALGCSQEYGTDYTETFSPMMKTDSFRTLLAYATMAGYEFHHFDVETAFLYGKLSETIYMTQPPGYQDDKKKTSVCILNQALYGLKQSGRVWIKIKDNNGVPQTCRALIDSGSQANFISGQCRKRLGLEYVTLHSQISGISGHFASHSYGLVEFEFTPHFKSDELFKVYALVLDKLTNNFPTLTCPKSNLAHLKTMPLADPDYNISATIDILIGAELAMTLFTGESVIGDEEQLTTTSSKLGWLLSGRVSSKGSRRSIRNIIQSHHACLETQNIVENFGNWNPFLM